MVSDKTKSNIPGKVLDILIIFISMAGYVPKHATLPRTVVILASLIFSLYLGRYQPNNSTIALIYFSVSELLYIGFIFLVLSKNGLRHWFIKKWSNENEGYLAFEAALGFLFYHNGACIGYISSATPGNLFHFIPDDLLFIILPLLFFSGLIIKIWAAKEVTIDTYYWKDMFLGRKISEFVVKGPYKYFSNPMYGIGQIPAYAAAVWYGSKYGLTAAFVNQFLIFTFYFLVEKKFIKRIYQ